MTFPIFLTAHLVYGVLMAFAMERRMRSEGEVLGLPMVWLLVPVAFVSAPLGAVMLRYMSEWFLHGAFAADHVGFERFQLGWMIAVGVSAGISSVFGLLFSIAFLSRDARKVAWAPVGVGALFVIVLLILDARGLFVVGDAPVYAHPAGLVSLAIVLSLGAGWLLARARLSAPLVRP
jgi:hypothetical protein